VEALEAYLTSDKILQYGSGLPAPPERPPERPGDEAVAHKNYARLLEIAADLNVMEWRKLGFITEVIWTVELQSG
jgi:hypothetical protein